MSCTATLRRCRIGNKVRESVEVHTKLNDSWTTGFVIAQVTDDGYRVARRSDGIMLAGFTNETDVRIARTPGTPWFGDAVN